MQLARKGNSRGSHSISRGYDMRGKAHSTEAGALPVPLHQYSIPSTNIKQKQKQKHESICSELSGEFRILLNGPC
ncbi:uncharacterized protein CCOS01_16882 [Colletotrichum costaricense]|uniref:Uncharacterized protein n=1 Tax=Colletotrichum costaricense TaxID=1209916 RepID=A0AAJ0DRM8_9PEZI|nr:uncharacterized protein CCOS01_16882 [Colletotrichum costaricense]KAK1504430.1 hypothetical protein CCOS01_16882 [Colletotrichum costaricense]